MGDTVRGIPGAVLGALIATLIAAAAGNRNPTALLMIATVAILVLVLVIDIARRNGVRFRSPISLSSSPNAAEAAPSQTDQAPIDPEARVALFTDVDEVLTIRPINIELARSLGVADKLLEIENEFYGGGTTDNFNAKFVPLFRGTDSFTKDWVEHQYEKIELRTNAKALLQMHGVDVYLVSSGPSYYIDMLAQRYPIKGYTCSRYRFDGDGQLSSVVEASGSPEKAEFVLNRAREYAVTVGLGNSAVLDGAFLRNCTISLLVKDEVDREWAKEFPTVRELGPVLHLLNHTVSRLGSLSRSS
jgi:phosphoserine phosphatase